MSDIVLQRDALSPITIAQQHVWPLKVTAVSNVPGLSEKVFVYHAAMDDDDFMGDLFECVASVQQLTEIPPDAPGVLSGIYQVPYYRTEVLEFHCRSPWEAEWLMGKIEGDVNALVRNWKAMQNLTPAGSSSWNGDFTYWDPSDPYWNTPWSWNGP